MKILLSLLILVTLAAPTTCGKNDGRCKCQSNCTKSLPCDQGFWSRTNNGIEPSCYRKPQRHQYEKVNKLKHFKGTENQHSHVSSFSINNEQYQLFTDNKAVIMTKWSEDDQLLHEKQKLRIRSAYSAEVIFHDGNAILLVAVYNISKGCVCDDQDHQNPSRAYHWNHTRKAFNENPFKYLPSARFKQSFSERYHNRSTVITVFGKCGCKTKIYYLSESSQFNEIAQNNSWYFKDATVIQSVRYLKSQYILFAPLNKHDKSKPIGIYKWAQSTGSLSFHRNLSTYINWENDLSTTVFKNDVFLCSVCNASHNVTIYRLNPDRGSLEELRHFQVKSGGFSMCKFHSQDHELYANIGYQDRVEQLQYNPVTRNFTDAGNLPEAEYSQYSIDLISFQSRDDAYIVTAGQYKKHKKSKRCYRNKVYRKKIP